MSLRKHLFEPYGLRARFAISSAISILICVLVFLTLCCAVDYYLSNYFEQSDFLKYHIQTQSISLQEYINENHISSENLQELKKWEHKQPLIILELYADGKCLYSSVYDDPDQVIHLADSLAEEDHTSLVRLADTDVLAVLYSDFTYRYYVIGIASSAVFALILFILLFLRSNQKLIRYICRLNEEVQILEGGNLEYRVSVEGNDEITDLAKSMNRMKESFRQQMESEQKLYRDNRRLVTEMSHDLRTPLTGMMLYLEILKSHRYTSEEELQMYLDKINSKAQHLKQLSDHLFNYSLTDVPLEKGSPRLMQDTFVNIINQFKDELSAHGFHVALEINWTPCYVDVNEEYLQRIFENITSNVVKYADSSEEIIVCTLNNPRFCGFSVMNTFSDIDHQTETNGIGIENISTMMKQMNGSCMVEQTDAAFDITLLFPKL